MQQQMISDINAITLYLKLTSRKYACLKMFIVLNVIMLNLHLMSVITMRNTQQKDDQEITTLKSSDKLICLDLKLYNGKLSR